MKSPRPSNRFPTKSSQLILEVEMPTFKRLTLDTTNFSSMIVASSLLREDKFLLSKANLMKRTDQLSERTETMKFTNNGTSSMLIKLNQSQPREEVEHGDFTSTDHSILFLISIETTTLMSLRTTELPLRLQMEEIVRHGSLIGLPEPSSQNPTVNLST